MYSGNQNITSLRELQIVIRSVKIRRVYKISMPLLMLKAECRVLVLDCLFSPCFDTLQLCYACAFTFVISVGSRAGFMSEPFKTDI